MFDLAQYRQFGAGLATGLVLALFVWLYDHRPQPKPADELSEVANPQARADKSHAEDPADTKDPAADYTFYDMLPKFEVTVPELDHGPRRDKPDEPVSEPGAYVLQVGSYRGQPDSAERMREKLAKLGITSSVQHITIDTEEWYRVRIGPISDLAQLNNIRRQLRAADIDAIRYRVGD